MYISRKAVVQLFEVLRYKPKSLQVGFPKVSPELFIDVILPATLWP